MGAHMRGRRGKIRVAFALGWTLCASPMADAADVPLDPATRILAEHNRERALMGVEPLSWSPSLAADAGKWANQLSRTGRFQHSPEVLSPDGTQGENLWAGTPDRFTPEAMVSAWRREKRFYRPGMFPDNSVTGRVGDVGHYTQMVWRSSRTVGCAIAKGANEDILVCRYAEGGNVVGERPV